MSDVPPRHWGAKGLPPALLLHCSLAHGGAWEGVARRLQHRLHMVAPDCIGHGTGPAPEPGVDYHDAVTAQARAALPAAPALVIGHSFGATVALRLALEVPGRVAALVLVEPVLFAAADADAPGRRAERAALAALPGLLARGDRAAAARLFLTVWGGGAPFDTMPAAQRAYVAERMWVIDASAPALHADRAGLVPRLGQAACPVLLLEGAASPPVMAEVGTALAAGLPRATRVVIPGAAHMLPLTHARAAAEAIGAFLDGGADAGAPGPA